MTRLGEELRRKFKTPQDAIRALGLDESILKDNMERRNMTAPTKFAAKALFLTAGAIGPFIAKDAKGIDLMPIFKDLTPKNFKAKDVSLALDGALKGRLAKDANMSHVAEMLDHLEHAGDQPGEDESVSEPQHKAMEAAAHGTSNIGIPKEVGKEFSEADKGKGFDAEPLKNFLREKGMSEDDMNAVMDMLPKEEEAHDEDEEEKKKREEAEKAAAAKDAELKAKDAEMKDMVKKPAMDEAIKSAVAKAREDERGIRLALAQVRPYVGDLPETLAFDSGDDVKRHALEMMGVPKAKEMHAHALDAVLSVQRKAGAQPSGGDAPIAMDAAATKSFTERYPGSERIGSAG